MAHTKEPWHTGGDGSIVYDSEGWGVASATVFHGRHDGSDEAKANARRIVACVNACAGLTTEELEKARPAAVNYRDYRLARQQCDQLQSAFDDRVRVIEMQLEDKRVLAEQRDKLANACRDALNNLPADGECAAIIREALKP